MFQARIILPESGSQADMVVELMKILFVPEGA
jgi:hypothetical protein